MKKELRDCLIEQARAEGICDMGMRHISEATDMAELVDYYVENPDWCLERGYPTYEMLQEYFSNIENKGVFVGKTFHGELLNERQAYIFHNCRGSVKVGLNTEKNIIPMIYIANGCRLHFVGTGEYAPKRGQERTIVPIYIFGQNDLSAKDNRYVVFNKHKCELI